MKSLWNMLNKEFTIEGAVSAFLVINIIAWTLITMGVGFQHRHRASTPSVRHTR